MSEEMRMCLACHVMKLLLLLLLLLLCGYVIDGWKQKDSNSDQKNKVLDMDNSTQYFNVELDGWTLPLLMIRVMLLNLTNSEPLRVDSAKQWISSMGFPQVIGPASAWKSENKIQISNKQIRLIKLLVGIGENVEVAKGSQRHGVELASEESTGGKVEMAERVESMVIKVVSVEGHDVFPVTLGKTVEIVETAFQKFRASKVREAVESVVLLQEGLGSSIGTVIGFILLLTAAQHKSN
ncbi:hypothetical protein VNO80_17338 [Phaseolus coccineus]|uniref:Uncharacterized protein n=1 Tax=Phaseolus coccineus TaxID=3886 RepID=A0AAN9R4U7_PHACN